MSPQETQVLQDFLNQLTQARGIAKDPQADALIASAVAQQPDAAYLLVQRALLMDQALNAAKAQIATLQSQVQSAQAPARGFLDPANAWGNSAAPASRPTAIAAPYQQASMQTAAAYQPPMQAPAAASGFFGGGIGNVLGSVATTAAGVAGGAFLFQGIEHLMGNSSNHGAGLFGQQAAAAPVENTTINNYYGDDASSGDSSDNPDSTASNDIGNDDGTLV
ncbi:putative transmembrane protein [Collimonas arenae]|uniref:Putative transmembrane protein n=1 Tax=Collimonas arenae TaxID=279058 RepID=A0A0A1FEV3_9BURK|nr:DUF2076 family protein [Collimonas arenae]AIY43263.1 putative transmembrane protein [Collimonas arenae]